MNPSFAFPCRLLLACALAPLAAAQPAQLAVQQYRTETDILYRTGGDLTDSMRERCRLDVYYPSANNGFATVVWFHGGGLTGGNRQEVRHPHTRLHELDGFNHAQMVEPAVLLLVRFVRGF